MAVSKHALLDANSVVHNIVIYDDEGDWQPDAGFSVQPVADDSMVAKDWTWDGTAFNPPVVPFDKALKTKLTDLASMRWTKCQTMAWNGNQLDCSDLANQRLTSAIVGLQNLNPNGSVDWQVAPGTFQTFDLNGLLQLAGAMMTHVQGCWNNAKALTDQINAATDVASLNAIDLTAGWPA